MFLPKNYLQYCRLIAGFCLVFVFVAVPVKALTVSPEKIEESFLQPEASLREVRIYNETNEPVLVTPEVANLSIDENSSKPQILPASISDAITKWLSFNPDTFKLLPGAWLDFPVKLEPPAGADVGGYYGALLFKSVPEVTFGEGISITSKTGPLLFLTIPGSTKISAELVDFQQKATPLLGSYVFDYVPEAYSLKIQNTGDVHVEPQGRLVVYNWLGSIKEVMPINKDGRVVLPSWIRNFEVLADGVGNITGGFMAEWRRFGLGKYTTAITMSVGEEIVHKEIDFWVFPWKTTSLAGLLVLGTLSISKWGKLRKRKK